MGGQRFATSVLMCVYECVNAVLCCKVLRVVGKTGKAACNL